MTDNTDAGSPARIVFYGSLMAGLEGIGKAGVGGLLRPMGAVHFFGRLYDLGAYPGVRLGGTSRVRAELYDGLIDATLAKLDAYEDCDPRDPAPFEPVAGRGSIYVRKLIDCFDGAARQCGPAWVYVYNGAIDGAALVPGGDWRAHLRSRR